MQNLVFSSGVILTLVTLALMGAITLPTGVVGHEGSTIVVIFNGLRLLRGQKRGQVRGFQDRPEGSGGGGG